ncbi:S41 family peptidase [Deminuibacter soli]|uniref:Tail specific protease domain-containing protein n=1 Tax=Deminuibacter soli TaxID=2291815 RepID=A0A3E1NNN5_9BACT|nr:S41 family peptidase [Deminuibacter soli]RFM29507.1 hypothetical protein DXN05_00535 [Deminuibacter soli]
MKRMHLMLGAALLFGGLLFSSCQKSISNENPPAPTDSTGNQAGQYPVVDTALAYTLDVYYWYKQIPSTFTDAGITAPDSLMLAIRPYSMVSGYPNPVDRYSFGIKQASFDNTSSGVAQDFGLYARYLGGTNQLYVMYVEREAPAGVQGIQRGWQILKVNGIGTTDTSSSNINFLVDAIYNSSTSSFTFQKPDGSTVDITLSVGTYNAHSVLADTVLTTTQGNVGYMAFNSFLGDSLDIDNNFKRIFSNFEANDVQNVVIDLRYNGGGYVYNAEKLCNYLAPASANGQTMFTEEFNDKHSDWNETSKFNKIGNLNLSSIFFIVSDETASASELVINNLKPFLSEKLVGPATHTYGKPVGFFNIPVGDWYIFPVSFRSINNAGTSDYYGGFTIDKPATDGVNRNWGDPTENCLAYALKYITTGGFRESGTAAFRTPSAKVKSTYRAGFNGAIDNRHIRPALNLKNLRSTKK